MAHTHMRAHPVERGRAFRRVWTRGEAKQAGRKGEGNGRGGPADLEQALDKAMRKIGMAAPSRESAAAFLQKADSSAQVEAGLRERVRYLEARLAAFESAEATSRS